jgi:hypothetical protein
MRTRMECNECGHEFSVKVGPFTYEDRCPKCRGVDTVPSDEFASLHHSRRAKGVVRSGVERSPEAARPVSAAPGYGIGG